MKTYLHGTDYESAMSIVANGLTTEKKTVWTCSRKDMLYVRDSEKEEAEFLTVESGQIAAAYKDSKSTNIGLVKITMSDELADELVEDDNSCEGTDGCYQIDIDALNEYVQKGAISITVVIRKDAYIPYLRAFYLSHLSLDYMQIDDSTLMYAIKIIAQNGIFIDEMLEYGDIEATYEVKASKVA